MPDGSPLLLPLLVVIGPLVIALVLPSKRDTSVAAWWMRIRRDLAMLMRAVIALACLAAIVCKTSPHPVSPS